MRKGTLNMSMALDIGKVLMKLQGLLVVALKIFFNNDKQINNI